VRFTQARTVEPLTNPALCSMFTSLYPHQHGATRNGLKVRPGLPSLARTLAQHGYMTAAFVGNWTLRDRISGLGEHFDRYDEVITRKRWLGLFRGEATAEDLTDAALAWLRGGGERGGERQPFLLWVHYVDPHAPYLLHRELARDLGIGAGRAVARQDRYDTEVAYADRHVGRLLAAVEGDPALAADTLVVFASDHGESLGEHGDWGHGRNLLEPALRIPMALSWPGRLRPGTIDAPALNIDLAPTVLGLLGLPAPASFRGYDWTPVLAGRAVAPERVTWFQAHRGAVLSLQEAASARRRGLLQLAVIDKGRKEIFAVGGGERLVFDLRNDPRETRDLAGVQASSPSESLRGWMAKVSRGLAASDRLAPAGVDSESLARLRSLGYAE